MEPILQSLSRLGSHFGEALRLRGRLASLEWAEERGRLVTVVLWTLGSVFLLAMAIIVGTIAVAAVFWETSPVLALTVIAVLYASIGGLSLLGLLRYLRTAPPFLHQTLSVFQEDTSCRFPDPDLTSQN